MHEEIKQRLRGFLEAKRELITAKMKAEEVENMLTGISIDYSKEHVSTTREPDQWVNTLAKLIDLHTECVHKMDVATEKMEDCVMLISLAGTARQQEILTRYYIKGQKWERVAVEMNIDYKHMWRLIYKAFEEIEEKVSKKP